jgi:hypothetical protein
MAAQLTAVHDWVPPVQPLPVQGVGSSRTNKLFLKLFLIALAALAVHGYHLGVDDAEIYVPAVKKVADPALFPFSSNEFFLTHAHLSLFSDLVGNFARWTHVPVDLAIFLSHVAGVFLLLLACWRVSCICFKSKFSHWGSVFVVAAVLTIPITGTGLFLMDSYVTARSISTPLSVLAIAAWLGGRQKESMLWIFLTALVHPQMAIYTGGLVVCLTMVRGTAFAAALPVLFEFVPAHGAAAEALHSRTYFLVTNWAWYEWVGVIAPILLLTWFAWASPRSTMPEFSWLAKALVPYGVISTIVASALTVSPRLENLTRLQPMRSFHLLYALFFILLGGLLGEYLLRAHLWRWCAVLIPVASAMGMVQVVEYSSSPHIEWPLARGQNGNDWINAFLWVRDNTPKDALFALDPLYMSVAEDDQHGFRAVAERSVLADEVKDSGAVSLFPQLADDWKAQVAAQKNWNGFQLGDYERLQRQYPVNWIVTRAPGPDGFNCPYRNSTLAVCHLDAKEMSSLHPETD